MHKRIPLIARDLKRLYTGFLIAALALFVLCSWLTEFNPMTLIANGEAFVEFITQDFLPPALPKASRIPGVLESVVVTLALALSSTTVAAILAFFVALFGSEKVSPFPKAAKFVRGFATFLATSPRWFGRSSCFPPSASARASALWRCASRASRFWCGPLWRRWRTSPRTAWRACRRWGPASPSG